jgi:hypothetical protein
VTEQTRATRGFRGIGVGVVFDLEIVEPGVRFLVLERKIPSLALKVNIRLL